MQTKVLVILSIFRYVHASILTFSWAAFSNLPICLHKYIEIFCNITNLSNLFCCLVDHWVAMVSVYIVSSKQNVEGCRYDLYSLGWSYLTAWIRKLYYELQALKKNSNDPADNPNNCSQNRIVSCNPAASLGPRIVIWVSAVISFSLLFFPM